MNRLLLKFKDRNHLDTRQRFSEIAKKYDLVVEDSFETPGRPDPTVNIIVTVEPGNLQEIKLALKRIPEILVKEK